MRILLSCHAFFPDYHAGTETLTKVTAQYFAERGHDVAILVPETIALSGNAAAPSMREDNFDGVKLFRMKTPLVQGTFADRYLQTLENPALDGLYNDLIRSYRPDVLHVFHLMNVTGNIVFAAKRAGVKVVATPTDFWPICPTYQLLDWMEENCGTHDYIDCLKCHLAIQPSAQKKSFENKETFLKENPEFAQFESALLRRALYFHQVFAQYDLVVPSNTFMRDTLAEYELISPDTKIVPFGAPSEKSTSRNRAPKRKGDKIRLGFAGTIRHSKGLHVLLEALEKCKHRSRFEVEVYGMVHEAGYFEAMNKKMAKLPEVKFLGTFHTSETENVLAGWDCLVIPSVWHENSPLIGYTSLQVKTPVLVSDSAGLRDLVHLFNGGELFPLGDSAALAQSLDKLAENPELLNDWTERIAPVPTMRDMANRLLESYATL